MVLTRKKGTNFLAELVATGQGVMVLNWKRVDLDEKQGRGFSQWGRWDTGTGFPEQLCLPHHWKCPRPGWMWLEQPEILEGVPTHGMKETLKGPCNPNFVMIPYFWCFLWIGMHTVTSSIQCGSGWDCRHEVETEGVAEPKMQFTAGQAQCQAGSHTQHPRACLRNYVVALWDEQNSSAFRSPWTLNALKAGYSQEVSIRRYHNRDNLPWQSRSPLEHVKINPSLIHTAFLIVRREGFKYYWVMPDSVIGVSSTVHVLGWTEVCPHS